MNTRDSAIAYGEQGLAVFPCSGKTPLTEHGFKDATTDSATIAAWWDRWPKANVAIATGPSGLVVIDIDQKNDVDGWESWQDLKTELALNDDTVTCETPTGGLHLYYRANGHDVSCSAGKLGPGLDVRARGGYVVAPPSLHPNGNPYTWALDGAPDECEMLPFPAALLERLAFHVHTPAGKTDGRIPSGQRNSTLTSLAGSMRRPGFSGDAIEAALLVENATRCQPPLSETEVVKLARSIARYSPSQPAGRLSKEYGMGDLLSTAFPAPVWVVPEMLPAGLCILAGRPKQGKSFLALQLTVAVGSGGRFLNRSVEQGGALYIALEDSPRRLQARLRDMQAPHDADVRIAFGWPSLNGEGLEQIEHRIAFDNLRLVVIDTLARAVGGRIDWDDVGAVTPLLGGLQELALSADVCILAVDHHRKGGMTVDVVDDVMGSTGKSAVADTVWGLYRQRGDQGATLNLTGRDIAEAEIAILFDPLTVCWQPNETAEGVRVGSIQDRILTALEHAGGRATTTELANVLHIEATHVSRELGELVAKRAVVKEERQGREVPYRLLTMVHGHDGHVGHRPEKHCHDENHHQPLRRLDEGCLSLAPPPEVDTHNDISYCPSSAIDGHGGHSGNGLSDFFDVDHYDHHDQPLRCPREDHRPHAIEQPLRNDGRGNRSTNPLTQIERVSSETGTGRNVENAEDSASARFDQKGSKAL